MSSVLPTLGRPMQLVGFSRNGQRSTDVQREKFFPVIQLLACLPFCAEAALVDGRKTVVFSVAGPWSQLGGSGANRLRFGDSLLLSPFIGADLCPTSELAESS